MGQQQTFRPQVIVLTNHYGQFVTFKMSWANVFQNHVTVCVFCHVCMCQSRKTDDEGEVNMPSCSLQPAPNRVQQGSIQF